MEFIKEYIKMNNLKMKTDNIKSKYLCVVCESILDRPKMSRCGMSFCSSCILGCTDCPSCGTSLDIGENHIADDFNKEIKINDLILLCPNGLCPVRCKVSEMETHLSTCTNKGVKCLFSAFGCSSFVESHEKLHEHITAYLIWHLDLLLANFADGENETKQKLDKVETKINSMEMEMNRNADNINAISENVNNLDEKFTEIDRKIKKTGDDAKSECNATIQREMSDLKREMEKLIMEKLNQSMKLQQEMNKKIKIAQVGDNLIGLADQHKEIFREMDQKMNDCNFTSDIFSLDSYHFKIGMVYSMNKYISFSVYLVKGPNDVLLKWPLKRILNLAILKFDGSTAIENRFCYTTSLEEWKSDYNRPKETDCYIVESEVIVFDGRVLNNNTVSVVLSMLE